MKTIKLLSYLLIALILMSFIPPPLDITGKYVNPRPPVFSKLDVRADSTYTQIISTDVARTTRNGKWSYVDDTLTTIEVIDPRELPQNRMDSIYFDFDRPYIHKYYVVNRDTLSMVGKGRFRLLYFRATDEKFDTYCK